MTEIEFLEQKLAQAEVEIATLRLQVANLMHMLRTEMISSGSLSEPKEEGGDAPC